MFVNVKPRVPKRLVPACLLYMVITVESIAFYYTVLISLM